MRTGMAQLPLRYQLDSQRTGEDWYSRADHAGTDWSARGGQVRTGTAELTTPVPTGAPEEDR